MMTKMRVQHRVAAGAVAAAMLVTLAGCSSLTSWSTPAPATHAALAPTPSSTPSAAPSAASVTQSPAQKKVAALVEAQTAQTHDVPAKGLVVATASVSAPDGSVGFHIAVTATGSDAYEIEVSDYHSAVKGAPFQMFLRQYPESLGSFIEEGVSFGYASWGASETDHTPPQSVDLSTAGDDPTFLQNVVITTASPASSQGAWKVVAVAPLVWHAPNRHSGLVVHDSGPASGATGTATKQNGVVASYLIARGDSVTDVEARFGLTLRDLVYLNARNAAAINFQLNWGQTLNLDPALR
jgi:hypothetical protein